jgi:hypothetical protein
MCLCGHENEPSGLVTWLTVWLLVSEVLHRVWCFTFTFKQQSRINTVLRVKLSTITITLTTLQMCLIAKHRSVSHFCHVAPRRPSLYRVSQKRGGVRMIHAHDNINWFHLAPSCEEWHPTDRCYMIVNCVLGQESGRKRPPASQSMLYFYASSVWYTPGRR